MSTNGLFSPANVSAMIQSGRVLLLAGDEALLSTLPAGKWIGGTSANFMAAEGGATSQDKIFVTDITDSAAKIEIKTYDAAALRGLGKDYPANGFSVLIVPGLSDIHASYAKEIQSYEGVFNSPLIGWIAGVHVSEIGKRAPKAFAGAPAALSKQAAVMHVTLPAGQAARIETINLFTQDNGDAIEFDTEGFSSETPCRINGAPADLATYITERKIDTKLPLVADYNGAMINVSVQSVDPAAKKVAFYAPVFKGITYRFAKPVENYTAQFEQAIKAGGIGDVAFSCNCILNFLYAELEGKKTGTLVGPITFGEIAYMLLNQTLVYLQIEKV